MRKIRVWKWENWPEDGQRWIKKADGIILILLTCLFLAGISACDQIPNTGTILQVPEPGTDSFAQSTQQPDGNEIASASEVSNDLTENIYQITPAKSDCHLALAGNPLDVTVPDGTLLDPGEVFVKIWRVRNTGACVWTTSYAIVWFSGEKMGIDDAVNFTSNILPGETIELSVDMEAPEIAGDYQSNWKICDTDANCFGLGNEGAYPFWAKISVRDLGTETPIFKPSQTPALIVLTQGRADLSIDQELNMDANNDQSTESMDLVLRETDTGLNLGSINGAEIAWFGQIIPNEMQCKNLLYVTDSISLQDMDTSEVLCYKSNLGLPGFIRFEMIDLLNGNISIEYTTWNMP